LAVSDLRFFIFDLSSVADGRRARGVRAHTLRERIQVDFPMMPESILIADDYDDNRELRLMLEGEGYHIREARNGREALMAALEEAPMVALIDLSMPSLDGWGLLREMRADERTRAVPCVAVTAFAANQDRLRALEAGFDAYISKPFRAKELIELVNSFARRDGKGDSDGGPTGAGQPS
jgi:CheY-like chemotaxis protein